MRIHKPQIWISEIEYYFKVSKNMLRDHRDHRELVKSYERLKWVVVVCGQTPRLLLRV